VNAGEGKNKFGVIKAKVEETKKKKKKKFLREGSHAERNKQRRRKTEHQNRCIDTARTCRFRKNRPLLNWPGRGGGEGEIIQVGVREKKLGSVDRSKRASGRMWKKNEKKPRALQFPIRTGGETRGRSKKKKHQNKPLTKEKRGASGPMSPDAI